MWLLEVEDNFCTSVERIIWGFFNEKLACAIWTPFEGSLTIFSPRYNFDEISNDEGWVESDTELTDYAAFSFLYFLDELPRSALGDGT